MSMEDFEIKLWELSSCSEKEDLESKIEKIQIFIDNNLLVPDLIPILIKYAPMKVLRVLKEPVDESQQHMICNNNEITNFFLENIMKLRRQQTSDILEKKQEKFASEQREQYIRDACKQYPDNESLQALCKNYEQQPQLQQQQQQPNKSWWRWNRGGRSRKRNKKQSRKSLKRRR